MKYREIHGSASLLCLPILFGAVLTALVPVAPATSAEPQMTYALDTGIFYLPENEGAASDYARELCRLDLYRPETAKGFPTVVFFHGGGLKAGRRQVPGALKDRGWAVVGVGYRLHPNVQHPTYIEDAAAAVAWTFKNIESFGGDPKKIFVTGISAGGYLTAIVETTLADLTK